MSGTDFADHQAEAQTAADAAPESEINLPDGLSFDELEQIKEAAVLRQREQRGKELAQDLNTIKVLVAKHSLKWADIKPEKKASTVAPKYRNPENHEQVWSGRGKPPLWIKDAEDRTPYLIG